MSSYDQKRKRVLKRIFVVLTLFLLSFTFSNLVFLFFEDALSSLTPQGPAVWVFIITIFVGIAYSPINYFYGWLFKTVFFPRRSHALLILHRLEQELSQTPNLAEFSNLLVNTLADILQLKIISLLIPSARGEGYTVISAHGWRVSDYRKFHLPAQSALIELIKAAGSQILLRERVTRSLSWQEAAQLTKDFEELRATCVIPLWAKKELVGVLNLMVPPWKKHFGEDDLRFFRDFSQEIARSLKTVLEIHQLRIANEELRDSQSQLLQTAKLAAIEQLATGIAHEIHNPLTIISGKAQVLLLQKDRKVYDEKVEEVLKTIVKQTRRAADITKKLLMFSRTSTAPKEKIRFESIVEDTLSLIAYQISLEGIEIQRLIAQDLPDFHGNVQELREVFLNLILNALQAIGPGGRIQLGISFQRPENIFQIQIADAGPGIPQENLHKVFNPFFTTRPEGTGLGLFVTQQIVHRYGGSIRVESEEGEGTLFVIELPLALESQKPAHSPENETGGETVHDTAQRWEL